MSPESLWTFLPLGYAITVGIELPILLVGLAPHHPLERRITAGFLLTAATYPIVVLVLPLLIPQRTLYLVVAETFAPLAECLLFHVAFQNPDEPASVRRDSSTIVVANLASFGTGVLLQTYGWL